MTPILVFDIETIPDVDGIRRLEDLPSDLSDAEVAEHAFDARREKTGSDFLPHHLQRVAAISCVFRDKGGFRVRSLGTAQDGEAALIQSFYRTIEKYTPQLVSWNGGGFDLPVLHYRALVHGIAAPRYWDMGEDDREFKWNNYLSRYHSRHTDLMDLLALYQPRASAPLDAMARLCGFPGKLGMDGGQVWEAYRDGQIDDIRHYCETDVVNTYLLYCRFQMMRGGLTPPEYADEIRLVKEALAAEPAPHWAQYLAAFPK
ncbi:3'-5' exonuclease [Burkholderia glumae]|uniref:3'-5' exonuclease n=1 Tax=Burkholderia glumae TaxID=337 RepID=A0AAQ0BUH9_BURGL|nr:3'-5' exonuclease [Burkholderia glumae]ACR28591.1 3'-5' exonuclease [Burkholderia glumae BGR1]AJY65862.1 DNA polymerase family B, exonuclease domain protein [Burkholderia glumae LMG 2196 = ATCC 33617]KHJ64561.1 3'-5' exonuclease [Burkholderia glumae]MCM2480388.1 3'-5' exonuclease [Burkholderia glumae]MCM2492972.1 3'-5' exonuclease [Burkholderia glumae]